MTYPHLHTFSHASIDTHTHTHTMIELQTSGMNCTIHALAACKICGQAASGPGRACTSRDLLHHTYTPQVCLCKRQGARRWAAYAAAKGVEQTILCVGVCICVPCLCCTYSRTRCCQMGGAEDDNDYDTNIIDIS
jgi:hypothetical protein